MPLFFGSHVELLCEKTDISYYSGRTKACSAASLKQAPPTDSPTWLERKHLRLINKSITSRLADLYFLIKSPLTAARGINRGTDYNKWGDRLDFGLSCPEWLAPDEMAIN